MYKDTFAHPIFATQHKSACSVSRTKESNAVSLRHGELLSVTTWLCDEQQEIQQIGVDMSHVTWLLAWAISLARSRANCSAEPDMVMWSTSPAFSYSRYYPNLRFWNSIFFLMGFYHREVSAPHPLFIPFFLLLLNVHNTALLCACTCDIYNW